MQNKLDRLQRLTAAMTARKRAADMQALVLAQRIATLEEAERAVFSALEQPQAIHGAMTAHYARRADVLSQQKQRLTEELRRVKLTGLECQRDVKRCEKLAERERRAVEHRNEAADFARAIEGFLQRR